LVGI
jgi:hypothetical protein